jgi:hypothetical protein
MTRAMENLSTRRQTCSSATPSQTLYGIYMDKNRVSEVRRMNYGKDRDTFYMPTHYVRYICKSTITNMATIQNVEYVPDKIDVREVSI